MKDNILTVDQVAEMLHLHPKTIRGFIREGKLKAKKIGKEWRIQREDIDVFTGAGETRSVSSGESKTEEIDGPDAQGVRHEKIQVTTIIDIRVANRDEADRISSSIMASANTKDQSYGNKRIDYIYYETESRARFLVFGSAGYVSDLLRMISAVSQ